VGKKSMWGTLTSRGKEEKGKRGLFYISRGDYMWGPPGERGREGKYGGLYENRPEGTAGPKMLRSKTGKKERGKGGDGIRKGGREVCRVFVMKRKTKRNAGLKPRNSRGNRGGFKKKKGGLRKLRNAFIGA